MIRKEDVIQMLDEWIDRLDESYVSEAIECVLLMVKNMIENMPECTGEEPERQQSESDWKESMMRQFTKVE